MGHRTSFAPLAALIAVLCGPAHAGNAPLEQARRSLDALDYEAAGKQLDAALEVHGNDRATLISIYELQGLLAGAIKQPDAAGAAFRALLSLDRSHKLKGKQPPRVTTPFFEAKSWVAEHGALELRKSLFTREADGFVTFLNVELTDPAGLVKEVRFVWDAGGKKGSYVALASVPEAPVHSHSVSWYAIALGANDAVLATLGDERAPIVTTASMEISPLDPDAPPAPPAPPERGVVRRNCRPLCNLDGGAPSCTGGACRAVSEECGLPVPASSGVCL